jgi:hypothetical protein
MTSNALHRVPAKLEFRGDTDVKYFTDSIVGPRQPDGPQQARLRGRRLLGRTVTVPQGLRGAVLLTALMSPQPSDPLVERSSRQIGKRPRDEPVTPCSPGALDLDASPLVKLEREQPAAEAREVEVVSHYSNLTTWEHDREPAAVATDSLALWVKISHIVMAGAYTTTS